LLVLATLIVSTSTTMETTMEFAILQYQSVAKVFAGENDEPQPMGFTELVSTTTTVTTVTSTSWCVVSKPVLMEFAFRVPATTIAITSTITDLSATSHRKHLP